MEYAKLYIPSTRIFIVEKPNMRCVFLSPVLGNRELGKMSTGQIRVLYESSTDQKDKASLFIVQAVLGLHGSLTTRFCK